MHPIPCLCRCQSEDSPLSRIPLQTPYLGNFREDLKYFLQASLFLVMFEIPESLEFLELQESFIFCKSFRIHFRRNSSVLIGKKTAFGRAT